MPSPDLQLSPVESGEDGYHALVSLLLVPLGCAAVVAGWVLYAMLALASPGGDYPEALPSMTLALPVVIGGMMAWTVHWLSKRLRSWMTIQILLALQGGGLIWLGAAEHAWEFVLVAVGLGVSGGVISAGVVHVRRKLGTAVQGRCLGGVTRCHSRGWGAFMAFGTGGYSGLRLAYCRMESDPARCYRYAVAVAIC